jgi:phage terminase large subunit-like protein
MRVARFAPLISLFAAPLAARETVGTFATWAAFCDEPKKCFAISEPAEDRGRPFLAVAVQGPILSVQAHIGRPIRRATIAIGGARFVLGASGEDAVADASTSRRIVAAMRQGQALTLIAEAAHGGRIRHHYMLAGAPSAIDAAAVATLR